MVLYLANASGPLIRAVMQCGDLPLGQMCTPAEGRVPLPGVVWAADNGCYSRRGWPGEYRWLSWLERLSAHADRCVFAAAPDVVGDAVATLDRSFRWLRVIRGMGYPAALVAQDGLEHLPVPYWHFDVLFIGGSTDWKLGQAAAGLVSEAARRRIAAHMGRVNSRARYAHAARLGCGSVDGTFLTYAPDRNLPILQRWLTTEPTVRPAARVTALASESYRDVRRRQVPDDGASAVEQ